MSNFYRQSGKRLRCACKELHGSYITYYNIPSSFILLLIFSPPSVFLPSFFSSHLSLIPHSNTTTTTVTRNGDRDFCHQQARYKWIWWLWPLTRECTTTEPGLSSFALACCHCHQPWPQPAGLAGGRLRRWLALRVRIHHRWAWKRRHEYAAAASADSQRWGGVESSHSQAATMSRWWPCTQGLHIERQFLLSIDFSLWSLFWATVESGVKFLF